MTSLVFNPRSLTRDIDRMVNSFFHRPVWAGDSTCDYIPRVNIKDSKDDVVLTFELPGMDKKDIKVTVQDQVLTVSGERKFESESEGAEWVRTEIGCGSFSRSFTLPDTVNTGSVSADYRQGLLEVKLAKKEEVKPKEIEVNIK